MSCHSHHPAMEPRGRYAGLSGRRTPTPRMWTFQGSVPVFRSLVLARPASARLRTNSTCKKRERVCIWNNAVAFLRSTLCAATRTLFCLKCTVSILAHTFKNCKPKPHPCAIKGLAFIPRMNRGAFCSVSVTHRKIIHAQ